MEVKGTTVAATPLFVEDEYGNDGFERWLGALSPRARDIYGTQGVATSSWYPLEETLIQPMRAMGDLFFPDDLEGGLRRLGRSSAEYGLKKVYRAFLKLGPPRLIVQRAGLIFGTFYRPGRGAVVEKNPKSVIIRFEDFPEKTGLVEIRIAGWMEQALEITGGKNPAVKITRSVSRGDPYIELVSTWE